MALIRLGDFIELYNQKCNIPNLTPNDVSGINRRREFFEPSRQVSGDTSNYKVVPPNYFACNLMHVGRDEVLPISLNKSSKNKVVSPAYTIFKLKNETRILADFLFMLVSSNEKDRYFWFHCDSSVRDGMDWNAFCDLEFNVPSIEIQKKYVAVYESLLSNLKSYESKLEDLKLVCDGYIEDLRKKYGVEKIGKYIFKGSKNSDEKITNVLGIGQNGFISPQKKPNESLSNYKILKKGYICYAPPIFNILSDAIDIYEFDELAVCSPIYETFSCDDSVLNPKFLLMWLKRHEFKRYAEFYSLGVRNTFDYDLMREFSIPIPPIGLQQSIVNVFDVYNKRKDIINKLKEKISTICPILIRGAIKEGEEQDARL